MLGCTNRGVWSAEDEGIREREASPPGSVECGPYFRQLIESLQSGSRVPCGIAKNGRGVAILSEKVNWFDL
jgi:hypothetical protein